MQPATLVYLRPYFFACLAMLAFTGNSLLGRAALMPASSESIGPIAFSCIRIIAAAVTLQLLLLLFNAFKISQTNSQTGITLTNRLLPAICLSVYIFGFSIAYVQLPAGIGAFILFGSVQLCMLTASRYSGESLSKLAYLGCGISIAGFVLLLGPFSKQPGTTTTSMSLLSIGMMVLAGIAWGGYSLLAKNSQQPVVDITLSFTISSGIAIVAVIVLFFTHSLPVLLSMPAAYAVISGSITSALGYTLWYFALPHISRAQAAIMQLSVPVLALVAGAIWLQEYVSNWEVLASGLILLGIGLVIFKR